MGLFNRRKKKQEEVINAFERLSRMDQMEKSGLIAIDISSSRVFISSTLASCYIGKSEHWRNFLTRVHSWFDFRVGEELRERHFKDLESKAIREARKKYVVLSKDEISEIRSNARLSANVVDVSAPEIKSFEFVIVSGTRINRKSEAIVVGTYNKGTFTMIPYEDVVRSVKS